MAVICPEARYASIRRDGAERPERLHLPLDLWRAVERELADTLPANSALAEALVPREHPALGGAPVRLANARRPRSGRTCRASGRPDGETRRVCV